MTRPLTGATIPRVEYHNEIAFRVGADGTTVHFLRTLDVPTVAYRPACTCGWSDASLDVSASEKDGVRMAQNRTVEHHLDSLFGVR